MCSPQFSMLSVLILGTFGPNPNHNHTCAKNAAIKITCLVSVLSHRWCNYKYWWKTKRSDSCKCRAISGFTIRTIPSKQLSTRLSNCSKKIVVWQHSFLIEKQTFYIIKLQLFVPGSFEKPMGRLRIQLTYLRPAANFHFLSLGLCIPKIAPVVSSISKEEKKYSGILSRYL